VVVLPEQDSYEPNDTMQTARLHALVFREAADFQRLASQRLASQRPASENADIKTGSIR